MSYSKIISVLIIMLGFAVITGILLGLAFSTEQGDLLIIEINGPIMNGESGILNSGVNAQSLIEALEEARINPLIKAVILDINSGGGSSVASADVVRAVKELNKTSIALIRDIGASGAYWIASACDHVIAHELSLVGSIGVTMEYLEFSGLMQKYNVTYVNLSYPENKNSFSQYKPLSPEESEWAMNWLKHAYNYLITDIASNRNITIEELTPLADGSLYMGYQALSNGLIDQLGSMKEAINQTGITEPIIIKHQNKISILDLISGINGKEEIKISI